MASRPAIRAVLAVFLAGLCVAVLGVALMLGSLAPVGGGCTNTTGPGPIVCTSPHQSTQFTDGAILSAVGSLVLLVGGTGLRAVGWQFPWRPGSPAPAPPPAGQCPGCGAANPAQALFCSVCSSPLAPAAGDPPAVRAS
jgi:hypothetical protein